MSNGDWHTDAFPELRPGPPWVMQEMIAAQPALVEALLCSPPPGTAAAADAIADAIEQNRPVIVCGCGTPSTPRKESRRCYRPPSTPSSRPSYTHDPR